MPEVLWKAYIDLEIAEGERERARDLYERLIQLSGHVKVWIAYALFEGEAVPVPREDREEEEEAEEEAEVKMVPGDSGKARTIFRRAYNDLKSKKLVDEVNLILLFKKLRLLTQTPLACGPT
jgi:crooked neck